MFLWTLLYELFLKKKNHLAVSQVSLTGKLFLAFVILHVVLLAYFIWFMVTASITETEDEVASIMRGEVKMLINDKKCQSIYDISKFAFSLQNSKDLDVVD